uniref:Uncharacterized protein n=1 Tax=Rhizophora mucronata TaxID=61149 RepID=A0A2P2QHS2_RHIMU
MLGFCYLGIIHRVLFIFWSIF